MSIFCHGERCGSVSEIGLYGLDAVAVFQRNGCEGMPEIVKTALRKTKLTDNILEPLVNGDMSKRPSDLVGEHQIVGIVPCTAGGLRPVLLLFTLTIKNTHYGWGWFNDARLSAFR